ncbi:hypothetical protein FISHEDRAFT_41702 [Fistulina hepatica ATCC 64428]|nr:hypothetical protein FISHEDRAFT_41702 [Fistulina hepatica ATCC 64428]
MDKFLSPHSPEAQAHSQLANIWVTWDTDWDTESIVAGCASYAAFERYLDGSDLFIKPRSRRELEDILRRYSYDAIHNAISRSRKPLAEGGYSRVCHLAEKSIRDVLNTGDNALQLLAIHSPEKDSTRFDHHCHQPSVPTK